MLDRIKRWLGGDAGNKDLPPVLETEHGKVRRVGVEIEFAGLAIEKIASILKRDLGGSIETISAYEYELRDTEFGTFGIELDFAYLKKAGRKEGDDSALSNLEKMSDDLLAVIAKQLVPFEVVSPPLPMDRIGAFDQSLASLKAAGAKGTRHATVYAFGLHLNPELPGTDADTVRRYMQAFAVLFEWLKKVSDVDLSRRITPYIEPWPREYLRKLVDVDYAPDQAQLIDDYLSDNPTRNRALDMTPLFAELDRPRLERHVQDDRIKARPTLHYRLPNCEIDQDNWSLMTAWRHWLAVERLANDPQRLKQACAEYSEFLDSSVERLLGDWAKQGANWAES